MPPISAFDAKEFPTPSTIADSSPRSNALSAMDPGMRGSRSPSPRLSMGEMLNPFSRKSVVAPAPANASVAEIGRGAGLIWLPTEIKQMSSAEVAEVSRDASIFVSEQQERLGVAEISKALEKARGDPGFRDAASPCRVDPIHVLVPELMPELDCCKWTGDGHFDMSKFPGQSPPTLGQVVYFIRLLDIIAAKGASATLVACSPKHWTTVAALAGAAMVLRQDMDADSAWQELQRCGPELSSNPAKAWDRFPSPFSTTGHTTSSSLRVVDCLAGLAAATELGWFPGYQTFDVATWTLLRRKFDASWLIPGEVLAFANPWGTSMNPAYPGLLSADLSIESTRASDVSASSAGSGSRHNKGAAADIPKAVSMQNFFGMAGRPESPSSDLSDLDKDFGVRRACSDAALSEMGNRARARTRGSSNGSDVLLEEENLDQTPISPMSMSLEGWDDTANFEEDEDEDACKLTAATKQARLYAQTNMNVEANEAHPGPMRHYRCAIGRAPPLRPTGDEEAMDPESSFFPSSRLMPPASPRGEQASAESALIKKENFVSYFVRKGIALVARLNLDFECPEQKQYVDVFSSYGIDIKATTFPDGDIPPKAVARKFIGLCGKLEKVSPEKCVAVHCMAGLGRTGALIGAFAVSKYGLDGKTFHGWTRICRPGTIQTEKQEVFLRALRRTAPILRTASMGLAKMMERMASIKSPLASKSPSIASGLENTTSPGPVGDADDKHGQDGEEVLVLQVFMAQGGVTEL